MTIETANRLYELRKKQGLSQEELAEKLGVSRQAVSKWERSEASPDTDNLIALAKIYGLSLDELIYGEKAETEQKADEKPEEENSTETDDGIFIDVNDGKNKVKIGRGGIFVNSEDGDKVKIDWNGIRVKTAKSDDDDWDDNDNEEDDDIVITKDGLFEVHVNDERKKKFRFWSEVPYSIICTVAYLLFGCLDICGGWGLAWVIFITIPIYHSLVDAIYKKRFSRFAYPVLMAFVFLVFGMYFNIWHPSWLVFVTIPIYYPIATALDKKIKGK